MQLLKDKDRWMQWKEDSTYDGDEIGEPVEYPCFVDMVVLNWGMQYERALYYYKFNLEGMISELESK